MTFLRTPLQPSRQRLVQAGPACRCWRSWRSAILMQASIDCLFRSTLWASRFSTAINCASVCGSLFAGAGFDALEARFGFGRDRPEHKIRAAPEGFDFRRVAEGIDDVVLALGKLLQDAFGQDRGPVLLAQFVADAGEVIARRRRDVCASTHRAGCPTGNSTGSRGSPETSPLPPCPTRSCPSIR